MLALRYQRAGQPEGPSMVETAPISVGVGR